MTNQTNPPTATTPTPPSPADPAANSLDAYIRENRLRYSEPALRSAAIAAGNSPEAVDAALARYRPDPGAGAGSRATKVILGIYVAVFAVLGLPMVLSSLGLAGGQAYGGIVIALIVWGVVMAVGFGASMIWVRSRRAGLIVVGVIVGLAGLALLGGGGTGAMLAFIGGVVLVVAAIALGSRLDRLSASMPVMLSVPILIALALGGACVATGIPFPGVPA